jgi:hypothetical protein
VGLAAIAYHLEVISTSMKNLRQYLVIPQEKPPQPGASDV